MRSHTLWRNVLHRFIVSTLVVLLLFSSVSIPPSSMGGLFYSRDNLNGSGDINRCDTMQVNKSVEKEHMASTAIAATISWWSWSPSRREVYGRLWWLSTPVWKWQVGMGTMRRALRIMLSPNWLLSTCDEYPWASFTSYLWGRSRQRSEWPARLLPLVSAWTGEGDGLGGGYALVILPSGRTTLTSNNNNNVEDEIEKEAMFFTEVADPSWWDVFYHAPGNGSAVLALQSGGYRAIHPSSYSSFSSPASPSDGNPEDGSGDPAAAAAFWVGTHHMAQLADAYLSSVHRRRPTTTVVTVPDFLRTPISLQCNLTDTWEVIAKPGLKGATTLLHCRIPFPLSVETLREREAAVIAQHGDTMAEALASWWRTLAGGEGLIEWEALSAGSYHQQAPNNGRSSSGGLFGEGEMGITGVEAWYVFCPLQGIYKVHAGLLHDALLLTDPAQRRDRYHTLHECQARAEASVHSDEQKQEGEGEEYSDAELHHDHRPQSSPHLPHHNTTTSATTEKKKLKKKEASTVLEAFKHKYLRCTSDFQHLIQMKEQHQKKDVEIEALQRQQQRQRQQRAYNFNSSSLLQAAITSIGVYEKQRSRPRWNPTLRAWEMWFPSMQQCGYVAPRSTSSGSSPAEHHHHHEEEEDVYLSSGNTDTQAGDGSLEGRDPTPASSSSFHGRRRRRRQWKTRVLLKCYRDRGTGGEESRKLQRKKSSRDGSQSSHPHSHHDDQRQEDAEEAERRWSERQNDEQEEEQKREKTALRSRDNASGPDVSHHGESDTPPGDSRGEDSSHHDHDSDSDSDHHHHHEEEETEEKEEFELGSDHPLTWRITEVQQRCLFDVEISSDLVCLWDDYLEQLRSSPIPCVEVQ